ncbi:rhomboid family intramembrane serine protease, partial [bacterium]|nr:rhomboid family intramembrane serine protease [bacterium]
MYQPNFSNRLDLRMTPVIKYLLFANAGLFILTAIGGEYLHSRSLVAFALSSDAIFSQFQIWRLVSYSFLHATFWHVFFNMLMLWMFG